MLFLFGGGRKDEDYEDDMFLECGSWKDHHGSMMNRVGLNWWWRLQEKVVGTTSQYDPWWFPASSLFWLRRKLFETLKIYTAEETEARQEALRLRMLFFCLGIWHGIFNDARWCTRTTSLLSAVKWILGVWNRLPEHLVWWNFKYFFLPFAPLIIWRRFSPNLRS